MLETLTVWGHLEEHVRTEMELSAPGSVTNSRFSFKKIINMYPWVCGLERVARKTKVGEESFGAVNDGGIGLFDESFSGFSRGPR